MVAIRGNSLITDIAVIRFLSQIGMINLPDHNEPKIGMYAY